MKIFNSGHEPSPTGADERRAMRTDSATKDAYQRGRRDERARRRGSPFAQAILVLAALIGVFVVALAIHEGSFARSGMILDQHIAATSAPASQALKGVAAKAGGAMQYAGDRMQHAGDRLKRSASGQS